jgi:uncharacterized protein YoxC
MNKRTISILLLVSLLFLTGMDGKESVTIDYSIWISTTALLLSAISVILTYRKYSFDKQIYNADRIQELKDIHSKSINTVEKIIQSIRAIDFSCDDGKKCFTNFTNRLTQIRDEHEKLYSKTNKIKFNPVVVKSIIADSARLLRDTCDIENSIQDMKEKCRVCGNSLTTNGHCKMDDAPINE